MHRSPPRGRRAARGHTLIELVVVLALVVAATSVLSPALRRYRDVAAVVAARESVAGLIAMARATAVARGGAEVHLDASMATAWLIVGADTTRTVHVRTERGVALEMGTRAHAVLAYDEVGIGRLANATLRFRRGDEHRSLVVSSFGRVRRP